MKVKFVPQNVECDIDSGKSVLDVAHASGIPIKSACNGMPSCAECRVKIIEGEYNVLPPSKKELSLIGTGYYIDQRRLSCQIHCFGDIVVDTSEHIEREGEGPVTKKFLSRVHKASAQESHSVGGIMIEQEEKTLREISETVKPVSGAPDPASTDFLGIERGRQTSGKSQDNRGGGGHRRGRSRGGGGGGGNSGGRGGGRDQHRRR